MQRRALHKFTELAESIFRNTCLVAILDKRLKYDKPMPALRMIAPGTPPRSFSSVTIFLSRCN
jgi:hypothetical protein